MSLPWPPPAPPARPAPRRPNRPPPKSWLSIAYLRYTARRTAVPSSHTVASSSGAAPQGACHSRTWTLSKPYDQSTDDMDDEPSVLGRRLGQVGSVTSLRAIRVDPMGNRIDCITKLRGMPYKRSSPHRMPELITQ